MTQFPFFCCRFDESTHQPFEFAHLVILYPCLSCRTHDSGQLSTTRRNADSDTLTQKINFFSKKPLPPHFRALPEGSSAFLGQSRGQFSPQSFSTNSNIVPAKAEYKQNFCRMWRKMRNFRTRPLYCNKEETSAPSEPEIGNERGNGVPGAAMPCPSKSRRKSVRLCAA